MTTIRRAALLPWLAFAALVGVLVGLPLVARAQDLAPTGALEDVLTAGVAASAAVVAVVLFARSMIAWLRQDTDHAKAVCMGLALATGLALGFFRVAPAVGEGLAGRLVGGLICAAVASYGRDFFVRGFRALPKGGGKDDPPPTATAPVTP